MGVGAVIGFKKGLMLGSMRFWYKQGAGEFAMTMIEAGYDPEVSKTVASIAALPYAAIEFMQWEQVTPGLRKGVQEITQQSMKSVMKRAVLKYGTTFTGEVLEEIAQEIIQINAESIASYFSGKGLRLNAEAMKANIQRVWETTKQAASAMALLPAPGMAIDVYTGQRSIVAPKLVEETAKQPTEAAKPPVESVLAAPEAIKEPTPTQTAPEAIAEPKQAVEGEIRGEIAPKTNKSDWVIDYDLIAKIKSSKQGTIVGKVGDFLISDKLKSLYSDALDIPIMVLNEPIVEGKKVKFPSGALFYGGHGRFEGKPTIFVSNIHVGNQIRKTIFEEAAHILRVKKGREITKQGHEFDYAKYEQLPEEISAKKMAEYAEKVFVEENAIPSPPSAPQGKQATETQRDLLGQPFNVGYKGKQAEMLNIEEFPVQPKDVEGQKKMEFKGEEAPKAGLYESSVAETGIGEKQLKKYTKLIEEKIKSNPAYQTELEAVGEQSKYFGKGNYYVQEKFRGEVKSAVENYPSLKFHITYDPQAGKHWDEVLMEMGRGDIDITYFLDELGKSLEGKKAEKGINTDVLEKAKSGNSTESAELQVLDDIIYGLESGKPIKEINANTLEWAEYYGLTKGDISDILLPELTDEQLKAEQEKARAKDEALEKLEAERLREKAKQTATEQARLKEIIARQERIAAEKRTKEEQVKKLRRDIHATAAVKGLTKKALTELKKKYTGYGKLTGKVASNKITIEQLQNLLTAVQKERPKRIGYLQVLKLKTEKQIQTLKENLTNKFQMTEAAWQDILKRETGGKEPVYVSAKQFITQQQARAVLKRMHNTATLLRVTNAYDEALSKDPEKSAYVNKIEAEITSQEHRDPFSLESMRYYNQQAQEKTGAPMFPLYKAMIDTEQESHRTREAQLKWLEAAVGEDEFAKIAGDEEALKRVSDYIDSQSHLENRPEMPKNITPAETKFAQTIQRILKAREIQSRLGKFFRWYELDFPETGEGAMADYGRYKKEIRKAVDIYDTQGEEELVKYLETQEWGIIHSGYDPKELILRKIQLYSPGAKTVGRGHIKVSTAVEFHEQERNILQRLNSYMRQMDTLSYMSPLINAYIQLYEDNAEKFSDWNQVKENVEIFLSELKHYNAEKGWLSKLVTRIYAQAAQTVLQNSPSITLYNAAEATAFAADKSILFDPRNKALTAQDEEFLETYVQQQRAMLEEYYLVNEKTFPGLEGLNKLARQISLTSRSDVFSRYHTFWAKINQVRRALEMPTLKEQISAMKLKDYSLLEQKMAMSIWARDGADAMARYVAKTESDNVHGLYERSQRSPAEMGSMGRVFANLMLFPRMWSERMARNIYEVFDPKTDSETKLRAAKTVMSVMIGGTIIGMGIGKMTGRRRNPYNPLEILGWRFGGLITGGLEKVSDLYNTTLEILSGDEITRERAKNKWPAVFTAMPEMFVPFYAHTIRALEKTTDTKYIDRAALRWLREQIDEDYKRRPEAYKFNKKGIINAVQYILIGRSVDYEKEKGAGGKSQRRGLQRQGLRR